MTGVRRMASPPPAYSRERRRAAELPARIGKREHLAAQIATPRPCPEKTEEAEAGRKALGARIEEAETEGSAAEALRAPGVNDPGRRAPTILAGLAGRIEAADRESLKDFPSG